MASLIFSSELSADSLLTMPETFIRRRLVTRYSSVRQCHQFQAKMTMPDHDRDQGRAAHDLPAQRP